MFIIRQYSKIAGDLSEHNIIYLGINYPDKVMEIGKISNDGNIILHTSLIDFSIVKLNKVEDDVDRKLTKEEYKILIDKLNKYTRTQKLIIYRIFI